MHESPLSFFHTWIFVENDYITNRDGKLNMGKVNANVSICKILILTGPRDGMEERNKMRNQMEVENKTFTASVLGLI